MRAVVLSAAVLAGGAAIASAQTYFDSMALGYTGTVGRFNDLDAALAALAGPSLAGSTVDARDLQVALHEGLGVQNQILIGTAWNLAPAGVPNPSATNVGFVQMADLDWSVAHNVSSGWDASFTQFSLNVTGTNVLETGAGGYLTRLWNTTASGGQGGIFRTYDFAMTATVGSSDAAAWSSVLGIYATQADPTAVAGHFRGVFENTSGEAGAQGFYAFDFSLNADSWLAGQSDSVDGYKTTVMGSAIPEPQTYALFLGAASLALAGWRRWRPRG